MDHEDLKDKMFMLYDGELPEAERPGVERHIEACAECRAALRDWKTAAGHFFRAPETKPSEAFVARVMRHVESERGFWGAVREAFTLRRVALAGAAAFAALAVFVATPHRSSGVGATENVQYMAELVEDAEEDPGLGTSVEEYFL